MREFKVIEGSSWSHGSCNLQLPVQSIFGKECVEIDCWTKRKQYDSLCQVLGSGVNQQLQVKNLQSKS
jgi:hypothetical protein